jgi:nitrate/nitrite transport system substrate-binding protein
MLARRPAQPRPPRQGNVFRIGFVPLLDAAPIIAAHELGLFAQENLSVSLHRQIGWANVRDKLTHGQLDASHALLGIPLLSRADPELALTSPFSPTAVMALGAGGNAITLSNELYNAGIRSATDLAAHLRHLPLDRPVTLGHVFSSSMHHYLLRDYLAAAGLDPDRDVRLAVIPPPQMPQHMAGGHIDGFCVGEPWNTIARQRNLGRTILATTELLPNHPEKVLAIAAGVAQKQPETLTALLRALLRACAWVHDPAHHAQLAAMLSSRLYLDQPAAVLAECLDPNRTLAGRTLANPMITFHPARTFPSKTAMLWLLQQMQRWRHIPAAADLRGIADASCDTTFYRQAATDLHLACPATDYPLMPLRYNASFDPASATVNARTDFPLPLEHSPLTA